MSDPRFSTQSASVRKLTVTRDSYIGKTWFLDMPTSPLSPSVQPARKRSEGPVRCALWMTAYVVNQHPTCVKKKPEKKQWLHRRVLSCFTVRKTIMSTGCQTGDRCNIPNVELPALELRSTKRFTHLVFIDFSLLFVGVDGRSNRRSEKFRGHFDPSRLNFFVDLETPGSLPLSQVTPLPVPFFVSSCFRLAAEAKHGSLLLDLSRIRDKESVEDQWNSMVDAVSEPLPWLWLQLFYKCVLHHKWVTKPKTKNYTKNVWVSNNFNHHHVSEPLLWLKLFDTHTFFV